MTNKKDILRDFIDQKVRSRGRNKGQVYGEYGHVYYSGDIMYSYGSHFPLLIRHSWGYLLNADKYSSTTSQHQSMCRSVATIQIPLSALRQAGIPYDKFNLIDSSKQREDLIGYYRNIENDKAKTITVEEYKALGWKKQRGWRPDNWDEPTKYFWHSKDKKERISVNQYMEIPENEKFGEETPIILYDFNFGTAINNTETIYRGITTASSKWNKNTERRPQHDVIEHDGRYFLSGMDGQNYFLCQLPEPVKTVDEAIAHLIPNELRINGWSDDYKTRIVKLADGIVRQGEWFFQKTMELKPINEKEYLAKHQDKTPEEITELRKEIKTHNQGLKTYYNEMQKNFILPRDNADSHTHIATRGMLKDGIIYVTGTVRHTEHQTLKLSTADAPVIYRAYRNRAVESFSVNGNVD